MENNPSQHLSILYLLIVLKNNPSFITNLYVLKSLKSVIHDSYISYLEILFLLRSSYRYLEYVQNILYQKSLYLQHHQFNIFDLQIECLNYLFDLFFFGVQDEFDSQI